MISNPAMLGALVIVLALAAADLVGGGASGARRLLAVLGRIAVATLLVVALSDPVVERSPRSIDVVFVVDRSASVPDAALIAAVKEVEDHRAELGPTERAGLVLVDAVAELAVLPGEAFEWPDPLRSGPRTSATDLGMGLRTALGAMSPTSGGRVVMLTDGRDTADALQAALDDANERGVPVDVVTVHPNRADPAVLSASITPQARPGSTVDGMVTLEAGELDVGGVLLVELGGETIHEQPIELVAGEVVDVPFDHPLDPSTEPGVLDLVARFSATNVGRDANPTNNAARTAVVVGEQPVVWFIANDDREVAALASISSAEGMRTRTLTPGQADTANLDEADLVVLGNVPFVGEHETAPFSPELASRLRRWVSGGGGLITLGGDRTYDLGGWGVSELGPVLPVELDPHDAEVEPSVAMVIILDKSGSMNDWDYKHRQTKMSLADAGAAASMRLLRSFDSLGVMAVDDRVHWVVPINPVLDRESLARRIHSIRGGGGGLYVYTGLLAAHAALVEVEDPLKHVILFSDARDAEEKVKGILMGWGPGPNSYDVAEAMVRDGITISVIGIGDPRDEDADFLELLADTGKGRYYLTRDAAELRSLFVEETRQLVDSAVHETPFDVRMRREHPAFENVDFARAPKLDGYLEVDPRATSTVWLTGPERHPIHVGWRYGLGEVHSFAVDLGPRWAPRWLSWADFPALWTQLVRQSLRRQGGLATAIEVETQDGVASVRIQRRADDGLSHAGAVSATLIPDGAVPAVLDVDVVEPGLWTAQVAVDPGRAYQVLVRSGDEAFETEFVAPPSAELRHATPDRDALLHIATTTGGALDAELPTVAAAAGLPVRWSLWPWLLTLSLLLMPVDAWLRRPLR
jgi:uncharacterized membrane protein